MQMSDYESDSELRHNGDNEDSLTDVQGVEEKYVFRLFIVVVPDGLTNGCLQLVITSSGLKTS